MRSAGIEPVYGNEDQAEVGHPVQQPVQRGLIRHRAGDDRLAVVAGDLEALEPGRPALIEDALDADLVARRRRRAAHARTPADGQPRLAPAGERSRVSSAICSVLSAGFRDLHATKRHLGVASPKGAGQVESSGPGMADPSGTVARRLVRAVR